ncbi:hypothetical protein [uncultured phage MedDCM-OCT-S04-C136]|nr:hypothetical protein [uncultured phage MedDCM-OCT-S04-C136]
MSYIGNTPAENYASFLTETFTVSATTNYTLSHAVANENDIRLVINGVVQQPGSGKAYTASGTTLTLSSATVSGDSMYAVYLGRALQTVNPPNASVGTAQLADSSVTSAKLGTKNSPAFHAYLSANQEPSNDTSTLVQFNTESFDTDNAYDNSSNYRFTPQVAGKYFVYAVINHNPSSSNNLQQAMVGIRKNGSDITRNFFASSTNPADELVVTTEIIVDLNGSSDYVDAVGLQAVSSGTNRFTGNSTISRTYFGAYKIIE